MKRRFNSRYVFFRDFVKYIVLFLLFVFYSCSILKLEATEKIGKNRNIRNIQSLNFQDGMDSVAIEGPWEFYWKKLLQPNDFPENTKTKNKNEPIPDLILNEFKPWSKNRQFLKNYSSKGYATYRTTIHLSQPQLRLAIYYPHLFTSSRIWVNGIEMAHKGKVSSELKEIIASRTNTYFSIDGDVENLEIILQVANGHFYQGGPRGSFYLGTERGIQGIVFRNIVLDILAFGMIFGSTIYHLFFYYLNKTHKPFLYFSIVSFTLLLRLPFHNAKIYEFYFSEISWHAQAQLLHIINIVSVISVIYFFYSLFPRKSASWLIWIYWLGGIIALLVGIINKEYLSLANLIYISIFLPSFIIHVIYMVFFGKKEKKSTYLIGLGVFTLGIFGIMAIVSNFIGMDGGIFLIIGFVVFVFLQALALSRFFTIALEKRSQLKLQMTKENQKELMKQREDLQIVMHDSLGSELTDIHVSLESSLKQDTKTFDRSLVEKIYGRILKVIQSFRSQLLFIEDLNTTYENPFTGINLTLLRRYFDAGREVDFNIPDEIVDFFDSNQSKLFQSSFYTNLFYLFSELCTNDLKYGQNESRWDISKQFNDLILIQENQLKEGIEQVENPTSRSISSRVNNLQGKCSAGYKNGFFCMEIKIPIPAIREWREDL